MNDDKRNRRRFLADMLFAGAALTGATFLAQSMQGSAEEPAARATPTPTPAPLSQPKPPPAHPGGVVAPPVHVRGEVAPPRRPTPSASPKKAQK